MRAAGYLCDLTTETTKTYSFGREEIADQGTDPGVPGPPPYGNSVKVTSDGVYWEKTRRMETLSDVLSVQDALDQVDVDLQSAEFSSTGCNGSQFERTWPRVQDFIDHHGSVSPCPPRGRVSSILVQKDLQRFRFAIPQTFTGVYFKITWDIVFYPEGSDPTNPNDPDASFAQQDATWEWTGPGVVGNDSSWQSPWFEIPVPEYPGENHVRNIRFECYRSKYGQLPQTMGIPYESPA